MSRQLVPKPVQYTKRGMDIVVALISFVIFSPAWLIVPILIKLEDRGPVFYRQMRLGLNGKPFYLIKFRTMIPDAEKHTGAVLQVTNDKRVTKIGNFLRKSRLDEVPNFINVLLGDTGVVGPRSERPEIYEQLELKFPLVKERTIIKPGITGEAQLQLRSDGSLDENSEFVAALSEKEHNATEDICRYKMYYDFAYALKLTSFWSFIKTDISIIIRTPYKMFIKRNVV